VKAIKFTVLIADLITTFGGVTCHINTMELKLLLHVIWNDLPQETIDRVSFCRHRCSWLAS